MINQLDWNVHLAKNFIDKCLRYISLCDMNVSGSRYNEI